MGNYLFTEQNGRIIPLEDKIFGINRLAKELEAKIGKKSVTNATLGSLLDDDGKLVVLSSVVEVLKNLDAVDYADYAPIGGTPEFKGNKKGGVWQFRTGLSHRSRRDAGRDRRDQEYNLKLFEIRR